MAEAEPANAPREPTSSWPDKYYGCGSRGRASGVNLRFAIITLVAPEGDNQRVQAKRHCRASQMWYLDQAPAQFGARAAGKKRNLEPDADMGLDDLETPAAKRITNSVFAEETAFRPDFLRWHPAVATVEHRATHAAAARLAATPRLPTFPCRRRAAAARRCRPRRRADGVAVAAGAISTFDAVDALISACPQPCAMAPGWCRRRWRRCSSSLRRRAAGRRRAGGARPHERRLSVLRPHRQAARALRHRVGEAVWEFDGCGDEGRARERSSSSAPARAAARCTLPPLYESACLSCTPR